LWNQFFDLRFAVASKSSVRTKRAGGSKPPKKSSGTASAKQAKPASSDRKKPAISAKRTAARPAPAAAAPKPTVVPKPAAAAVSKPAVAAPKPAMAAPKPKAASVGSHAFAIEKLHQVALQATNLDAAINFYRDVLGLKFITRYDPPGLAFFDMGPFRLLLSATASGATLYFRVVDIDDAVKSLRKRGVTFLNPPAMIHRDETGDFGKKGAEEWMAFFKDPSGNILALTERR
jgi:methylmalonyl-CoA/ethylmalonyl-CoA epimerase